MKRWIAVLMMVAVAGLSGCGSDSDDATDAPTCTEANARELEQVYITESAFEVDCVKTATNVAFYFVNNDAALHTVTTAEGAPEQFDAELPEKNSTYSHTFTTPGTYEITCKRHNERMTLIVT